MIEIRDFDEFNEFMKTMGVVCLTITIVGVGTAFTHPLFGFQDLLWLLLGVGIASLVVGAVFSCKNENSQQSRAAKQF